MKIKVYDAMSDIVSDLTEREKDVILRRFGLGQEKQTLQAVGDIYGLTRERVRQIQDKSIVDITPKLSKHSFLEELSRNAQKSLGKIKIKRERTLLDDLGRMYNLSGDDINYLRFFLILHKKLSYNPEDDNFHGYWGDSTQRTKTANQVLKRIIAMLSKRPSKLWTSKEIFEIIEDEIKKGLGVKGDADELKDFMRILKVIGKNPRNEFGLFNHPHISPTSLDDKVYFVLDSKNEHMHFTEIYDALQELSEIEDEFISKRWKKDYSKQSIQNLLIMNPEFVWAGRGTYALKKWGVVEGTIQDIMANIVKKYKEIDRQKLMEELAKERRFSKITFEAYLRDKSRFSIAPDGTIRLVK